MYKNIELDQKVGLFRRLKFTIVSNREIHVSSKSIFQTTSFKYPLQRLLASPITYRIVNQRALVWSIVLGAIIALCLGTSLSVSEESRKLQVILSLVLSPVFLYSLNTLMQSLYSRHTFKNREDGSSMFTIYAGKPSGKDVNEFISELKIRSESTRNPDNISYAQKLANYLNYLEFLYREGVVLEDEFKIIQNRIANSKNVNVVNIVKDETL